MLLPLALYGVERRRTWLAAAALASIPLSGQVHLALGAIPFVLVYALARRGCGSARSRRRRRGGGRPRLGGLAPRHGRAPVLGGRALLGDARRLPPATRVSSSGSSTSAGCSRSQPPRASGACVSETQSPPGAGSPSCSGSARSSPACSRSARTCPATACSGGIRPCKRPASRSGCCRSPASASRPWRRSRSLVFQKHKLARGSSRRSRASSSRSTSGCRSTTRSSRTRTTRSTPRSRTRRPGACSSCLCSAGRVRGQRLPLLRDAGAARALLGYATSAPPAAFRVARAAAGAGAASSASALSSSTATASRDRYEAVNDELGWAARLTCRPIPTKGATAMAERTTPERRAAHERLATGGFARWTRACATHPWRVVLALGRHHRRPDRPRRDGRRQPQGRVRHPGRTRRRRPT